MTCRSYKADNLSLIYLLTGINHSCRKMSVNCHFAVIVCNHCIIAVTASAAAGTVFTPVMITAVIRINYNTVFNRNNIRPIIPASAMSIAP